MSELVKIPRTAIARGLSASGGVVLTFVIGIVSEAQTLGIITWLLAVVVGASIGARFGMDNWLTKRATIAPSHTANVTDYWIAFGTVTVLSGTLAILAIAATVVAPAYDPAEIWSSRVFAVSLVPLTVLLTQAGWFQGIGFPAVSSLFQPGAIFLECAVLVLVFAIVKTGKVAQLDVAVIWLTVAMAQVVIGHYLALKGMCEPNVLDGSKIRCLAHTALRQSLPMVCWASSDYLLQWSPVMILGVLQRPDENAVLGMAFRLAQMVALFGIVINTAFAPAIGRWIARKVEPVTLAELRTALFVVACIGAVGVLVVASALSTVAPLIQLPSATLTQSFVLLSIAQIIFVIGAPADMTLIIAGYAGRLALLAFTSLIVCTTFTCIAATRGGVVPVVAILALTLSGHRLASMVIAYRSTGIRVWARFTRSGALALLQGLLPNRWGT